MCKYPRVFLFYLKTSCCFFICLTFIYLCSRGKLWQWQSFICGHWTASLERFVGKLPCTKAYQQPLIECYMLCVLPLKPGIRPSLCNIYFCFCWNRPRKDFDRLVVMEIIYQTLILLPSYFVLSRCPWLSENISSVIPIYIAVIFLFTLANFCMATFMDPGVFPRGKHKSFPSKITYHMHMMHMQCFLVCDIMTMIQ